MTIVYRCDNCGRVMDVVISSGTVPTPNGVYVSWKVEPDRKSARHLYEVCLRRWFLTQGTIR